MNVPWKRRSGETTDWIRGARKKGGGKGESGSEATMKRIMIKIKTSPDTTVGRNKKQR